MKLDLSKLQNVKHLSGGKTTAQCPACAADGSDAKKEHLVIFPDGRFGCVVHPKDKDHNKLVVQLVGARAAGTPPCRLTVQPLRVNDSRVLMKVGRLGRVKSSPEQPDDRSSRRSEKSNDTQREGEARAERQQPEPVSVDDIAASIGLSEDIMDETLREFLDLPAMVA